MDLVGANIGYHVGQVVDMLLFEGARRATKYLSPKLVISAARPYYKNAPWTSRATRADVVLKIGAPNYEEREFIKKCRKVGEPFPVKKIQLKFPPVKGR